MDIININDSFPIEIGQSGLPIDLDLSIETPYTEEQKEVDFQILTSLNITPRTYDIFKLINGPNDFVNPTFGPYQDLDALSMVLFSKFSVKISVPVGNYDDFGLNLIINDRNYIKFKNTIISNFYYTRLTELDIMRMFIQIKVTTEDYREFLRELNRN